MSTWLKTHAGLAATLRAAATGVPRPVLLAEVALEHLVPSDVDCTAFKVRGKATNNFERCADATTYGPTWMPCDSATDAKSSLAW